MMLSDKCCGGAAELGLFQKLTGYNTYIVIDIGIFYIRKFAFPLDSKI